MAQTSGDRPTPGDRPADPSAGTPQRAVFRMPFVAVVLLPILALALVSLQPFWTPNIFAGWPEIADPQALIFSPLSGRLVGRYGSRPSLLVAGATITASAQRASSIWPIRSRRTFDTVTSTPHFSQTMPLYFIRLYLPHRHS